MLRSARLHLLHLVVLTLSFTLTLADVEFLQPLALSSYVGGSIMTITWQDSGNQPLLADITTYTINLCAGGNAIGSFECSLAVLVATGNFAGGNHGQATIPAGIGADAQAGYFLQIISTTTNGAIATNYSPRITLTSMTGSFPALISTALSTLDLSTTTTGPPSTYEDGTAGPWATPYNLQVGPTRYAPMQPLPGSRITATGTRRMWPTSRASVARTWLPAPGMSTTLTQVRTWSVSSRENSAAPAGQPTDEAMARWLARWKD